MEAWQTILLAFGGNAALLAVLGWLGKSLLEKTLARDSQRLEYELKAKADSAIEQLRSQLQLQAIEHQIRFSSLHEKSAETIAEVYARLQKYLYAVADYVKVFELVGEKPKSERREEAQAAIAAFREYFLPRQIFIPKETAERIRAFDRKLLEAARHFANRIEGKEQSTTEDWIKTFETVIKEAPPILEELEDEFRKLLGQQTQLTA